MPARLRRFVKHGLAPLDRPDHSTSGVTILIYHRVGGGSNDELDLPLERFERQLDHLADHDVVPLDAAIEALEAGEAGHRVVLTFDDGFADVYTRAWPLLRERALPFTVYVATRYVGARMQWEGSTATSTGRGLTWDQLAELAASPLCTVGNHTHSHVRPDRLSFEDIDRCTTALSSNLGIVPRHFAYPWGVAIPALLPDMRRRFRTAVTGEVGRNAPGADPLALRRVPVRASDPDRFFAAKFSPGLRAERGYDLLVRTAKSARGAFSHA